MARVLTHRADAERRYPQEAGRLCQNNTRRAKIVQAGMRDHAAATGLRDWLAASARTILSVHRETRWSYALSAPSSTSVGSISH